MDFFNSPWISGISYYYIYVCTKYSDYLHNLHSMFINRFRNILYSKTNRKTENSRLYDLLQEHGYIEIVKETSIVTRQQIENLAKLDDYVKMPGICKSAQDILEKHPKLKHITSTNTGIIYPKLHEKYQKIIRKIAQEQTHSNVINSQEGRIKYEYITTN